MHRHPIKRRFVKAVYSTDAKRALAFLQNSSPVPPCIAPRSVQ